MVDGSLPLCLTVEEVRLCLAYADLVGKRTTITWVQD